MTELLTRPTLPALESYTDETHAFTLLGADPEAERAPGDVLRFWHDPSNRIYVFECMTEVGNLSATGLLSQFSGEELVRDRDEFSIKKIPADPSLREAQTGSVVFERLGEHSKSIITAPFTCADYAHVPEIGEQLEKILKYEQQRAPFSSPAAQEVLRHTVDYLTAQAQSDQNGLIARATYLRTAEILFDELVQTTPKEN